MLGNFPRQTVKWPERATYNLRRCTAGLWRTSFDRTCLAHLEMDGWWRGQKHVEIPSPIINIIFTAYIYHIYIHIHLIRSVISIIYILFVSQCHNQRHYRPSFLVEDGMFPQNAEWHRTRVPEVTECLAPWRARWLENLLSRYPLVN